MVDGFGAINWWGFSPAIDFLEPDTHSSFEKMGLNSDSKEDEVNILMVGAGDSRHLLMTIARSYRHAKRKINFYVIESNLELYARHLLFLHIALEPQCQMGLQEKTELFLELFGNSLVRSQSMDYVQRMATEFIKMVTDFDYLSTTMPIFDLSNLKFKERDMLEAIFKMWRNPDAATFDVEKCWELRLRNYLGERYDAIPNVFDWDFQMKLSDKGAGVIGGQLYSRWRHKGLAFTVREGNYDTPNRTLASGMIFNQGERHARRGYWGDIIVSPYIAYGITSEEQSLFKKANNLFTKSGEDVAEFNVAAMLHEIMHGTRYELPETEPAKQDSAVLTEIQEENENESSAEGNQESKQLENESNGLIPLDGIKIILLPLGSAPELHKKSKFQKFFNIVYFSNSMVHHLNGDIHQTFADNAHVILESSEFMLELKKEQHEEYNKKVTSIAQGVGCQPLSKLEEGAYQAVFKFSRPTS